VAPIAASRVTITATPTLATTATVTMTASGDVLSDVATVYSRTSRLKIASLAKAANRIPPMAPAPPRSTPSAASSRITRHRLDPSACLTASSCRRDSARANTSAQRLAAAISSTSAAMPRSAYNGFV
jgi:hypothetical protein